MSGITVGTIIDKFAKVGNEQCFDWLLSTSPHRVNKVTLKKKLEKLINQYKNLLKSKSKKSFPDQLENMKKQTFEFPKTVPFKSRKSRTELEVENVQDFECAKNVICGLAEDLAEVKCENITLTEQKQTLTGKINIRLATKSRLQKALRQKKLLKKQITHANYLLTEKNRQLKQLRASKTYSVKKCESYEKKCLQMKIENEQIKQNLDLLNKEVKTLQKEANELREENEYLQKESESNVVKMFDINKNCFKAQTQECVFELLNNNVSTSKVAPVISTVLNLVDMKADRLPSTSTVNNMNVQRLIASQKQLGQIVTKETNMCLLSDETSKFGKKMEGFHVSTESREHYILGTRQIVTKSGKDTLTVLKEILDDINEAGKSSTNEAQKSILLNISSTMSDRASTQLKFNDLLESYRKEVVMEHYQNNWPLFSENEKLALSSLNHFFCGLHALVHVAGSASDTLKVLEDAHFEKQVPIYDCSFKGSEPAVARLVRTASKAFSCGGDEKSGVYGHFKTFSKEYLTANKLHSSPIKRYHGNRFNILFENASCVFFMHEKMKEYLEFDSSNKLLRAVKHDLDIPFFVAGLKSLGMIHYLITSPLWTYIERKDVHILESCSFHAKLCKYIEDSVTNISAFVEGNFLLDEINSEQLTADVVYRKLIESKQYDDSVEVILKTILPAILETLKRLFADFIYDGKWTQPPSDEMDRTRSVPMHNKFSETIFGHIDRLLREKPNISFIAQEAYVMFCHNKTMQWIKAKSCEQKSQMFRECRKEMKDVRAKFQQRRKEIELKRKELMEEKMKEKEEKEKKRVQKLQQHSVGIVEWGLWQTEKQVDEHLKFHKTKKDKTAALKAQLHFRKNVLKQKIKTNDKVYRVTKVSLEKMTENVKSLIAHSYTIQTTDEDGELKFVGMDVSMKFDTDDGIQWYDGYVISKVPGYPSWYNIKFENDIAIYTYELLSDYQKGDLKIKV